MTDKPSRNEDEYFVKQDAELLKETRARLEAAAAEAERRSHYMKCPKDGYDLVVTTYHGVTVETCPHCGGFFLDRGELAKIEEHHDRPGLLSRFIGDVLTGLRTTHMPTEPDENVRHAPGNPLT
ncbi:MAG TPA: zf-TFIIB domain-containing protein [Gemmatimonadales bacterium]|nr:zf-TFIIB domain-containing protein [Gemmatimonadales bacterium]